MALKERFLSALTTHQYDVDAHVYRCPEDGEIVVVIPADEPIPGETEDVQCPNGHWVSVPKYRGRLSSATAVSETP